MKGARTVRLEATAGGRSEVLEISGGDGRYRVTVGSRVLEVDTSGSRPGLSSLLVDGRSYEVALERDAMGYRVDVEGERVEIQLGDGAAGDAAASRHAGAGGPLRVAAPMPGRIVRVLVEEGAAVEEGQGLMVMEAMKMENELRAPRAGTLREIGVREGQAVETGALLALLE